MKAQVEVEPERQGRPSRGAVASAMEGRRRSARRGMHASWSKKVCRLATGAVQGCLPRLIFKHDRAAPRRFHSEKFAVSVLSLPNS